jgi:regulatory protein
MSVKRRHPADAQQAAVRLLAARPRTSAQLAQRLAERFAPAQVEAAVERMKALGYLDDAGLARARSLALLGSGGQAPRSVARRLIAWGIPAAMAATAVAEAQRELGYEPIQYARAFLERQGIRPDALDARAKARVARRLLGRGFDPEVVGKLLELELGEE